MNKLSIRHTPPMFSRQWEAARDEARDLDKYAPDWDGAGADPVPLSLIYATLRLFRRLEDCAFPAPDLVYPAADGTVMVEWHHSDGFVQVANVRRPDRIDVVELGPDGAVAPVRRQRPAGTPAPKGDAECADGDAFEFTLAA